MANYNSAYTGPQIDASIGLAATAQQPPSEGPFVNGDKDKLDGIEAGADVTDTANVTAAGALMDSEVANLAAVKAFNPADYATAAQGTLASTAQQPPSEGPFVNGDKDKLDGIEAGADVTDTANVTAAGALMDSEVANLAAVKSFDPADYATSAQGTLAGTAVQPGDNVSTLTNDAAYIPSDPTGITGADAITNIISLTQAEYDALGTYDASTLYVIEA